MSWGDQSQIHRTAKLLLDRELVRSPGEAEAYLRSLILQVTVGGGIATSPAGAAALATVLNTAQRVFLGGVRVRVEVDASLQLGWVKHSSVLETVARFGGTVVDQLEPRLPTILILDDTADGSSAIRLSFNGWSGGVTTSTSIDGDDTNPLAGVLAGAIAVSEQFQRALGDVMPGRRDAGVSLWMPGHDWRSESATGPVLEWLPSRLWLLGVGHLGQAYAWTLGFLPYTQPASVTIGIVDFDVIERANLATQLLTTAASIGDHKARRVAAELEGLGFRTRVVERAFDETFRPVSHGKLERDEPRVALAGFDSVEPRQHLDVFDYAVDAGLGSGPVEYLDAMIRSFPGTATASEVFVPRTEAARPMSAAYEAEITHQIDAGVREEDARCGLVDLAGIAVGASFVGATVSCLVVADVLRFLHGGPRFSAMGLDLRNPAGLQVGDPVMESGQLWVPNVEVHA